MGRTRKVHGDTRIESAASIDQGSPYHHSWAVAIDRAIGAVVDPLVAVMIVVEVCLLAAGVVSRYLLHGALTWSDEVATILFLWLSMLGAVAAYRRGEHMRLTAVVRMVSENTREWFAVISSTIVAIFCLELLPASSAFFNMEQIDLTPALNIPRSYVIASIIVALVLIFVISVLRLIESDLRKAAITVALAAVISGIAWTFHGQFAAFGNWNLVIFFIVLVGACVAIGVPIAFAFGVGSLSYLSLTTTVPLSTIVGRMDEGISNLILLAVPLFILLGLLIEATGIAKRLVGALASLVGHVRGGLSVVLVAAMYLVSGISGSKAADMAAVAPVLFPEMERRGLKRSEMVALLATSGAMAETIPPSLVLIIIGSVVGISIRDLFTAGLLPAVVVSIALLIVALSRSRSDRVELAKRASLSEIGRAFLIAIPGLLLPLVIRFFVVAGVATATEVSTVGIIYSLLVGLLIYREFNWKRAYPMLRETASLTGAIMLIIATATAMGWSLTQSGFAQQLADGLSHAGGPAAFMALSVVLFVILGSVLEGIPAIVLFGPLLFPIAAQFHINEIQYAIVAVLAMGVGLFAPPLGIGYYAACVIGKASPDDTAKAILPYIVALMIGLALVAAIPWISIGFLKPSP